MFKTAFSSFEINDSTRSAQIIATENIAKSPEVETIITALNEENSDYSDRKRYHHAEKTDIVINDLY
ncbi:unnamed protein product [Onchocerca flexuosa]|uniref:DNA-binding protein n=1 Tax=Onchocerca flexuosa TaxID=387005 RepID=A0A183H845_9BILA|nr:unnamed protein product [Onchocerca flexuosa]